MTTRQKLIKTLARLLGVEPPASPARPADPVDYVATLHDAPDRVYVWICRESTPDDQIASIAESIGQKDPKALHVVCRDIAEIRKLSPEDVRRHLAPVVQRAQEAGWQ